MDNPLDRLACNLRNVIEVGVVVKNNQPSLLRSGGDQKIRNLSPTKTLRGEKPLHLSRSVEVLSCYGDKSHDLERHHQLIPLGAASG